MTAALDIVYCNTFITVKVKENAVRRAGSTPARSRFSSETDSAGQDYVETLPQGMAELQTLRILDLGKDKSPSGQTQSTQSDLPDLQDLSPISSADSPDLNDYTTEGGIGHPELCRRPCIYFLAGNCENGKACCYCHQEHADKMPKLDKRQRTLIQGLRRPELIALVKSFCEQRPVSPPGFGPVRELLDLLEEESAGAQPLATQISERDVRNLHKTLARMNFSNLICLVTHQAPSRAGQFPESAARLSAALERLRQSIALSAM